ncbi:transcriptional regulator, TetR family [Luteibacter sp. UNC138MFCol5.1]|uniref:TetR/AcrR family transcriptional regulator n=1 Tax=Luteibacter sp. UNC138MFCol5.1 TaxID=1502774 RepID=UPI0008B5D17D|nr:TetR/AcrR family transcriptional regulator [Luteibacter sp. UNC138MFCol5.1]SEO92285.1 transcriptional regulator, TetR family [Luteibacter sp. UNC138MFCol5.1]
MSTDSPPIEETPLRADAARNRERILEAADEVFSERGADASLDDIARRAKVGIGTLYRRFPTRDALLAALCDERMFALAANSRTRDDTMEPGASLRTFMVELATHASHYQGLAVVLGAVLQSQTAGCHAGAAEGMRLLDRAKRENAVAMDVSFDDLLCVITATSLAAGQGGPKSRITHLIDMFFNGIKRG